MDNNYIKKQSTPTFNRDEYMAKVKYAMENKNKTSITPNIEEAQESPKDDLNNNYYKYGPGKIRATEANFINNIEKGVFNWGEELIDFGASIASNIFDAFGNHNVSDHIDSFIKTEWSGKVADFTTKYGIVESIASPMTAIRRIIDEKATNGNLLDYSLTKDLGSVGSAIESGEQSIGQMIPSIAIGKGVGAIAGKLGVAAGRSAEAVTQAATKAAKVASLGSMGVAAAGGSTQEALQDGANTQQATGYGLLSGATEVGTELLVGPILQKIGLGTGKVAGTFGKTVSSNLFKTTAGKTAIRLLKTFNEEGMEEVASDLLSPLWKQITYKSDESYKQLLQEQGGIKGLFQSYIIGGTIGSMFEGFDTIQNASKYDSIKNYTAALEFAKLNDLQNKIADAKKSNKIDLANTLQNQYDSKKAVFDKNFLKYIEIIKSNPKASETAKSLVTNYEDVTNPLVHTVNGLTSDTSINNEINVDKNGTSFTTNEATKLQDSKETTINQKPLAANSEAVVVEPTSNNIDNSTKIAPILNQDVSLKDTKMSLDTSNTKDGVVAEANQNIKIDNAQDSKSNVKETKKVNINDTNIKEQQIKAESDKTANNKTSTKAYKETKEERLLKKFSDYKTYQKDVESIRNSAKKMKDKAHKANRTMNIYTSEKVAVMEEALGKMFGKKSFNNSFRSAMAQLSTTYVPQDKINMASEEGITPSLTPTGLIYNESYKSVIDSIANGKGKLSIEELDQSKIILKSFAYQLNKVANDSYNINGKEGSISDDIAKFNDVYEKRPKLSTNAAFTFGRNYVKEFADPHAVFAMIDDNNVNGKGFFTDSYEKLTECEKNELIAKQSFDEMINTKEFTSHNYKKHLNTFVPVHIGEQDIMMSNNQLISLYETCLVESGITHIKRSGFHYQDEKGYWQKVHHKNISENFVEDIKSKLTEKDLQFVDAINKCMKLSGTYKAKTDMELLGVSNTIKGHYFPTQVYADNFATNLGDVTREFRSMTSVNNLSFNKSKVSTFGSLAISPSTQILNNYLTGISKYYGYGTTIDYINRVMNGKYKNEDGKTKSLRWTLSDKNIQEPFIKYFNDLLLDVQGLNFAKNKSWVDKTFDKVRTHSVSAVLGLNISSVFKQMPSYIAAQEHVSVRNLTRAFTKSIYQTKAETELTNNSPYMKERFANNGFAKGTLVSDTLGTINKIGMAGLSWGDKTTLLKLYTACKFQVESNHKGDLNYKFGTSKNIEEAASLIETITRETQPSSSTLEKGKALRTNSTLYKFIVQYKSQPLKSFSRLYQHASEIYSYERALKAEGGDTLKNQEGLRTAKIKTTKTAASILAQGTLCALIGSLMKTLIGKKDWDEWSAQDFISQTLDESYIGMLPVVSNIYGLFKDNYEVSIVSLDNINDALTSFKSVINGVLNTANGEDVNWGVTMRKFTFAMSNILGIPTKNLYNYTYGIVNVFNPSTAYKMRNVFYTTVSYNSDYKKALESGNKAKATTILETACVSSKMGTSPSKSVINQFNYLVANGYENVIPSNVGDTINIDGTIYELKNKNKDKFKKVYAQSNDVANSIVESSTYKTLNDEGKAKALRLAYSTYYDLAKLSICPSYDTTNKYTILSKSTLDISSIIASIAKTSTIVESNGTSRPILVQKYINRLNISKNEKYLLYKLSGYKLTDDQKKSLTTYLKGKGLKESEINKII